MRHGRLTGLEKERPLGADLRLFSVTLNNDTQLDRDMLDAYRAFRLEASAKGFRHFLEVFVPNACGEHSPDDMPRFLKDEKEVLV